MGQGRRRANHEGTKPRHRKDGRWVVQVMLDGKRHDVYGRTAQEARQGARKLIADHQRGLDLEAANVPLAEFLNRWLETTVRRKREGTYRSYENAVRVHILPNPPEEPLGQLPLGKITRGHVEAWIADRLAAGLAPYTVWRLHATLRAGLNRALKADPPILARDPASLVDPIQYEVEEIDPLSAPDARRVLQATRETTDHALYAVALGLGLREGELLGLRWAGGINDPGVDLERGEVRVYQQLQFGRLVQAGTAACCRCRPGWSRCSNATAPCSRPSASLPARSGASTGWSSRARWARRARPATCGSAGSVCRSGWAWARGPHAFHDLRHTFATLARHAGVPLWKVSKLLGHRDISITLRVYGHLTPEGREDVAGRIEEVLGPRIGETAVRTAVRMLDDRLEGAVPEMGTAPLGVPGGM